MLKDEELLVSWKAQLESVQQDVERLVWSRQVFHEFEAIALATPHVKRNGYFFYWVANLYRADQAMTVRRLVDENPESHSFVSVLAGLAARLDLITRERHVRLYKKKNRRLAESTYDFIAGPGVASLTTRSIMGDRSLLIKTARAVERYTTKHLAHRDKDREGVSVTYGELSDSIDLLREYLKKYRLLLEAKDYALAPPTWSPHWSNVFTAPWAVNKRHGVSTTSNESISERLLAETREARKRRQDGNPSQAETK